LSGVHFGLRVSAEGVAGPDSDFREQPEPPGPEHQEGGHHDAGVYVRAAQGEESERSAGERQDGGYSEGHFAGHEQARNGQRGSEVKVGEIAGAAGAASLALVHEEAVREERGAGVHAGPAGAAVHGREQADAGAEHAVHDGRDKAAVPVPEGLHPDLLPDPVAAVLQQGLRDRRARHRDLEHLGARGHRPKGEQDLAELGLRVLAAVGADPAAEPADLAVRRPRRERRVLHYFLKNIKGS